LTDEQSSMVQNHLFTNHALHQCEMPLFEWEIGVRGRGFLCHYQGIVWNVRLRRLESKILSPLGPCPPPPLSDGRQPYADNQTNGFLALADPPFHCLGGRPPGRFYACWLYARIKKLTRNVCCIKRTKKHVWTSRKLQFSTSRLYDN